MAGAFTLADFRAELIRVACRRRARRRQYRRSSLIALYGEKAPLPDVLGMLAHDCPKRGAIGNDSCGAYFPDLAEPGLCATLMRRGFRCFSRPA